MGGILIRKVNRSAAEWINLGARLYRISTKAKTNPICGFDVCEKSYFWQLVSIPT